MVTGGWGESLLDSTEILIDNAWRTVTARLPTVLFGMKIATINNRVLLFGN